MLRYSQGNTYKTLCPPPNDYINDICPVMLDEIPSLERNQLLCVRLTEGNEIHCHTQTHTGLLTSTLITLLVHHDNKVDTIRQGPT
jgi:hypothetical protein